MLTGGHIKIHRKVMESAIWKNINDWRLAETILLMANWKPGEFASRAGDVVRVDRGMLATSVKSLVEESGLSTKMVRTSLLHLEKADFLAIKTAKHYSIITVMKYNTYQDMPGQEGKTKGKHSANTRQTLGNDIRREEGKKKELAEPSAPPRAYEPKTDLQRLICAYKELQGFDPFDREWDRLRFAKNSRAAKELLRICGGLNNALRFQDDFALRMKKAGLSWSMEAVKNNAADEAARARRKDY